MGRRHGISKTFVRFGENLSGVLKVEGPFL
jgi:hypothetical protein